jgi:uncharacterized membrane protein
MYIQLYIISTIVFFLIDLVWLSVIAKDLYQRELGFLMKDKPNLIPAVIFYLLFTIGLVFFVIMPGIEKIL